MSDHEEAAFLPPRVKDPSTLPEPIRGFYEAGDDGWARPRFGDYDEDDPYRFEDVRGLKTSKQKEAADRKAAEKRAAELEARLEGYGDYTAEQIAEAMQIADKVRSGQFTGKDQFDAKLRSEREQLTKKFEAETQRERERREKLEASVRRDKIDSQAEVIAAKLGLPARIVAPLIKEVGMVIEDEDGNLIDAVRDDEGNARVSMRSGQSGPMRLMEYAEDILAKDPEIADLIPQKARGGAGGDRIAALRRNAGSRGYDPKMSDEARLQEAYKLSEMNPTRRG
jgi:hypothetical protein